MLVKIEILPQEKKIEDQQIKILDNITFTGEVIGSTQNSQGTMWIINPKSLALSFSDTDSNSSSLAEILSLILIKREDKFRLKLETKKIWGCSLFHF